MKKRGYTEKSQEMNKLWLWEIKKNTQNRDKGPKNLSGFQVHLDTTLTQGPTTKLFCFISHAYQKELQSLRVERRVFLINKT